MDLGIVTTIGPSSQCRAQAQVLGSLLEKHYPTVPRVAIAPPYINGLKNWPLLISDDPSLKKGFESKLAIWRFTPFRSTLFLDVDIVPVQTSRSLDSVISDLIASIVPVSFYADRRVKGEFQKLRIQDLKPRGINGLWTTRAGGHYFWRTSPEAYNVFQLAQRIADEKWRELKEYKRDGAWRIPDEVCVSIAIEMLYPGIKLPEGDIFVGGKYYEGKGEFVHFYNDRASLNYMRMALKNGAQFGPVARMGAGLVATRYRPVNGALFDYLGRRSTSWLDKSSRLRHPDPPRQRG